MKEITETQAQKKAVEFLTQLADKPGKLPAYAQKKLVTESYLRMVLGGHKPAPAWLLKDLGIVRVRQVTHKYMSTRG